MSPVGVSSGDRRHRLANAPVACLLCWALLLMPMPAAATLQFHFQDQFSPAERQALVLWIEETHGALEALVGRLPFDVHVNFHRRDGASQPVPWAHTRRWPVQAVHFYVDPQFPAEAFRRDWTAAHELGHLVLPYLGPRQAWFAEGFASWIQYQVMQAMGVLDEPQTENCGRRTAARLQPRDVIL